jgi:uncharacterized protein YfaQ (DUF2300 family)
VETDTPGGGWICLSVRGVHLTVGVAGGGCHEKTIGKNGSLTRQKKWQTSKLHRNGEKLHRNGENSRAGDRITRDIPASSGDGRRLQSARTVLLVAKQGHILSTAPRCGCDCGVLPELVLGERGEQPISS